MFFKETSQEIDEDLAGLIDFWRDQTKSLKKGQKPDPPSPHCTQAVMAVVRPACVAFVFCIVDARGRIEPYSYLIIRGCEEDGEIRKWIIVYSKDVGHFSAMLLMYSADFNHTTAMDFAAKFPVNLINLN